MVEDVDAATWRLRCSDGTCGPDFDDLAVVVARTRRVLVSTAVVSRVEYFPTSDRGAVGRSLPYIRPRSVTRSVGCAVVSSRVPGLEPGKYARVERERRFLLADFPPGEQVIRVCTIVDRYLLGTRLRLRKWHDQVDDPPVYKLTQKVPAERPGPAQGLITNMYLSQSEYDVVAQLPADVLSKTRYSVPPFGVDVFDPPLEGLVLAEVEFDTDTDMQAFPVPSYAVAEVTGDGRLTGGRLARTGQEELQSWLADYGPGSRSPG